MKKEKINLRLGTRIKSRLNGATMDTDTPSNNPEFEFNNLEKKVNALLSLVERLQEENSVLKQGQEELLDERSQLLTKNEMTKKKVEEMIAKLKSMGHGA